MAKAMRNGAVALAVCAALSWPALAEAEITWREKDYNPQPAEGDLVLPMPCGGAMVFRPVLTPNAEGALGDVSVMLGQENSDQPYVDGLRRAWVAGGFPAPADQGGASKGLFFMAKYELAQAQFDAMAQVGSCPEDRPRKRAFVPQTEKTPLEFAQFALSYSEWLLKNAADALPVADEVPGYLRLPSEDEWEFAARGGAAVEPALFRAARPPMEEGHVPTEFIAHGGTDSAGGRVQIIGTLLPNPLGLHDMLGNAAELTETPFSLVRHGRLHGQIGGAVKRGGDARTPLEGITSATRYEVAPLDTHARAILRDRFTGARLVIAAPTLTSSEQADQMNAALDALAKVDEAMANAASEAEVLAMVEELIRTLPDPLAQSRLGIVRETIRRGQAERNEQRNNSIRLIATSGTLICDQAIGRLRNAIAIAQLSTGYAEILEDPAAAGDPDLRAEVESAQQEAQNSLNDLNERLTREVIDFANLIEGLSGDYSVALLGEQIAFIGPEIAKRGSRRTACLGLLDDQIRRREADGVTELPVLREALENIALAELAEETQ